MGDLLLEEVMKDWGILGNNSTMEELALSSYYGNTRISMFNHLTFLEQHDFRERFNMHCIHCSIFPIGGHGYSNYPGRSPLAGIVIFFQMALFIGKHTYCNYRHSRLCYFYFT